MSFDERRKLLEHLEKKRGAIILSMVYSKYAWMSTDDASLVYEVIYNTLKIGKEEILRR